MQKKSTSKRSESEQSTEAKELLNTLLTEPKKGFREKDSISDFYSDLASAKTEKRNLAINKNTADRHGRT